MRLYALLCDHQSRLEAKSFSELLGDVVPVLDQQIDELMAVDKADALRRVEAARVAIEAI